jgi:hypothetical protein
MRKSRNAFIVLSGILVLTAGSAMSAGPVGSITSETGPVAAALDQGIAGTVTNEAGEPIAEVFVQATSLDANSPPIPDIAIMTDAEGRFGWPLRPGAYRLTFILDGREIGEAEAVVEAGHVSDIDLLVDE